MIGFTFLALLAAQPQTNAPTTSVPPVPPPQCEKPRLPERFSVAPEDVVYLVKKTESYNDCINAWLNERNRRIQQLQAEAKAEADAANVVLREAADLNASVKAILDRSKGGAQ